MRFYHMLNDHMIEADVGAAAPGGSRQPWNREQCTNPGAAHAGEAPSHARNKVKVTPVFASHRTACKQTPPPPPPPPEGKANLSQPAPEHQILGRRFKFHRSDGSSVLTHIPPSPRAPEWRNTDLGAARGSRKNLLPCARNSAI